MMMSVVTPDSFVEARVGRVERNEVGSGIVVHRLHRSGPQPDARFSLLVPPWCNGQDVHLAIPGPQDLDLFWGGSTVSTGAGRRGPSCTSRPVRAMIRQPTPAGNCSSTTPWADAAMPAGPTPQHTGAAAPDRAVAR